jgi:acyltransferase
MRLAWIDALKGFGIILVVFAHYNLPAALDTYIFSFHMPLFFFISGFRFNFVKYTESATNFVKGRFKSLIIPYFGFAVLTCLFYFLLDEVYSPGVTSIKFFEADILYMIYSILYASGPMISYNSPLWFLTCLFVTELLFYWLAKRYYWQPGKLVIWLTGARSLFRKIIESIEEPMVDSGLPKSGLRFNKVFSRDENFLLGLFVLANLLYFVYLLNIPTDKINMNVLKYGGFFSFYLFAFSGIFMINKYFPFLAGKKNSSAGFKGFKFSFRKSSD